MKLLLTFLALFCGLCAQTDAAAVNGRSAGPDTPRELFNTGTRLFREGKLREAEIFLESATASQDERLQPTALYNLGHVRFAQGIEELKKGPSSKDALDQGSRVSPVADAAINEADEALRANDLQKMVAAYTRGRGVRKDLKTALTAVKRALEAHSGALLKWQRSSGDFHGVTELQPSNADARHNADVVDRHIAKLIDSLQQLQAMAAKLGNQTDNLKQLLKQLRGKIPAPDMPPGAAGDEDEEEEDQPMPQQGQKEAATREGQRLELTPEQAAWLLEGFRLDKERRLPMGQGQQGEPKDRNRPTW